MAFSEKFTNLSDLNNFHTGFLVVGDVLFEVDHNLIVGEWDVTGTTPGEKAASAREEADLSNRKRIVYDDEGVYDEYTIRDEGELLTNSESYERMDEEDRDD